VKSQVPPSDDYKILNILGVESEVDSAALRMELCHKNPEFHEIHGIDPYSAYLAHAIVWIAAAAGGGAIGNGTYEAAKRGIKALLERQRRDENAQLSKREAYDFALYAINIYQYTVLDDRPVCFEFEPISGHMTSGKWTIVCKRWFVLVAIQIPVVLQRPVSMQVSRVWLAHLFWMSDHLVYLGAIRSGGRCPIIVGAPVGPILNSMLYGLLRSITLDLDVNIHFRS
jgi:hypothetical protein